LKRGEKKEPANPVNVGKKGSLKTYAARKSEGKTSPWVRQKGDLSTLTRVRG